MTLPSPTLHSLVLVLCRYNERGEGRPYRERDSATWFSTVERCRRWIGEQAEPDKFYSFPLRTLAAQRDHLKVFLKDGFTGVICDPKESGSAVIPIDDLVRAIERELAERT